MTPSVDIGNVTLTYRGVSGGVLAVLPAVLVLAEALAAAGDPAGALTALATLRERLADELGVDPSPEVERLHLALLRGEVVAAMLPPPHDTTALAAGCQPLAAAKASVIVSMTWELRFCSPMS